MELQHRLYRLYHKIKERCENPNFNKFAYYGGKGVRCLISISELRQLWFRDCASKMDRPSIDRIDSNGNYCLSNCRFIELEENRSRGKGKFKAGNKLGKVFKNGFDSRRNITGKNQYTVSQV